MAGNEVRIRRQGAAIVVEPIAKDWAWLDENFQQAVAEQSSALANSVPGPLGK